MSVTLLCLQLCVLWTLCRGQTCSSTGAEGSSCSTASYCRGEHGRDEDENCSRGDATSNLPDSIFPKCGYSIPQLRVPAPCESFVPSNISALLDNPIRAINVSFYSVSRVNFRLNISWDHPVNAAEGYQVKIRNDDSPLFSDVGCFCIYNPNSTSIGDVFLAFGNRESKHIIIEVSLIHNSPAVSTTAITSTYEWPRTCLDVIHTDSTCALPVYGPPTNITVCSEHTPDNNQTLHIEWSYLTNFPLPKVYYVEVFTDSNYHDFVVYNTSSVTNSITVTQLDDSVSYSVSLRSYVRCSGLANKTIGLGCGSRQAPISPTHCLSTLFVLPTTTASGTGAVPTPELSPSIVPQAIQPHLDIVTVTSIAAGVSILLVILLTLIVAFSLIGVCYKIFNEPADKPCACAFPLHAPKTPHKTVVSSSFTE